MHAPDPARSEAEVPSTWPLTTRYVAVAPLPQVVVCTKRHPCSDEAAVGGGGVHDAVGQRPDPDPAGLQGGDDVDEVAQVAPEPVNLP